MHSAVRNRVERFGWGGGDWQSVGRTCKGGKGRILNGAKPPDTQLITLNKTFAQLESSNLITIITRDYDGAG